MLMQNNYKLARRREAAHAKAFPKKSLLIWTTNEYTVEGLDETYRYLCRLALRTLNLHAALNPRDMDKKLTFDEMKAHMGSSQSWMAHEDLTAVLFSECLDKSSYLCEYDGARGIYTLDNLEKKCNEAATWALGAWRRDFIPKRSEMGRKGGKKSKTPFKYKTELLDGMLELTPKQQLVELADTGISQAALYRLRDRHPYYAKNK
jgi:hypothetical protein